MSPVFLRLHSKRFLMRALARMGKKLFRFFVCTIFVLYIFVVYTK